LRSTFDGGFGIFFIFSVLHRINLQCDAVVRTFLLFAIGLQHTVLLGIFVGGLRPDISCWFLQRSGRPDLWGRNVSFFTFCGYKLQEVRLP